MNYQDVIELLKSVLRKENRKTQKHAEAEIDELVRRIDAGISAGASGKYLYIPAENKPLAKERNAKIARDYENGVSVPNIMTKYGLSRAAVYKILKKQSEILQPKK